MSEPRPTRRFVFALFASVAWGAVVFATFGILAVALDRDPISTTVSVFVGPATLAVTGIATGVAIYRTLGRRSPLLGALTAAAAVYLLTLLCAVVVSFPLFAEQATSPFTFAAVVLAAAIVSAAWWAYRHSGDRTQYDSSL